MELDFFFSFKHETSHDLLIPFEEFAETINNQQLGSLMLK